MMLRNDRSSSNGFYITYSFLRNFLGQGIVPGIAVDVLQSFPANCLYGRQK